MARVIEIGLNLHNLNNILRLACVCCRFVALTTLSSSAARGTPLAPPLLLKACA